MDVMGGWIYEIDQCQGHVFRMMVRLFFLRLYLAGRCSDNLYTAWSPARCKSGPGNNIVSRRYQLLYHVSTPSHLHFASFYAMIYFWKKLARGNPD